MIVKVFSITYLVVVCARATFRLQRDHEQTILTNYDATNPAQFNEISATNTNIYMGTKICKIHTCNNTIHVP